MSATRVGGSPRRVGGQARVTGQQQYVADIRVPDALQAKLVTLDCARARIISIDTSAAERLPGVHLVMTAADLPQPVPRFGPQYEDRPVLAVGETKYHGEPVAIVAADTEDAAEEAARLVRVEYEELPAVFTIAGALDPAAPSSRTRHSARRIPSPTPTFCTSIASAGATWTRCLRTSWSRTRTSSPWSPISRSSRTRSWPLRTATGSSSGAPSSIRTGCRRSCRSS